MLRRMAYGIPDGHREPSIPCLATQLEQVMNASQRDVLRVVVPPLLALGLVALVTRPVGVSAVPVPAPISASSAAPLSPTGSHR